jgi:hypothetical protein
MPPTDKYRIEVLAERYAQFPDLRDVFVEGFLDKGIVEKFLKEKGIKGIKVLRVEDSVIVPSDLYDEESASGAKSRIVALAQELNKRISKKKSNFLCVFDKDLDDYLDVTINIENCLPTDYTCMEMYFVNEECFEDFHHIYLRRPIGSGKYVFENIQPPLVERFLVRLTLKLKKMAKISISKKKIGGKYFEFDKKAGTFSFKKDLFIKNVITTHYDKETLDDFASKLKALSLKLPKDCRHKINGHDLYGLLSLYARQCGISNSAADEEAIERALPLTLKISHLEGMPLFIKIEKWASTN